MSDEALNSKEEMNLTTKQEANIQKYIESLNFDHYNIESDSEQLFELIKAMLLSESIDEIAWKNQQIFKESLEKQISKLFDGAQQITETLADKITNIVFNDEDDESEVSLSDQEQDLYQNNFKKQRDESNDEAEDEKKSEEVDESNKQHRLSYHDEEDQNLTNSSVSSEKAPKPQVQQIPIQNSYYQNPMPQQMIPQPTQFPTWQNQMYLNYYPQTICNPNMMMQSIQCKSITTLGSHPTQFVQPNIYPGIGPNNINFIPAPLQPKINLSVNQPTPLSQEANLKPQLNQVAQSNLKDNKFGNNANNKNNGGNANAINNSNNANNSGNSNPNNNNNGNNNRNKQQHKIYIKYVPRQFDQNQVLSQFQKFGKVQIYSYLIEKSIVSIQYSNKNSVENAIKQHGLILGDPKIFVSQNYDPQEVLRIPQQDPKASTAEPKLNKVVVVSSEQNKPVPKPKSQKQEQFEFKEIQNEMLRKLTNKFQLLQKYQKGITDPQDLETVTGALNKIKQLKKQISQYTKPAEVEPLKLERLIGNAYDFTLLVKDIPEQCLSQEILRKKFEAIGKLEQAKLHKAQKTAQIKYSEFKFAQKAYQTLKEFNLSFNNEEILILINIPPEAVAAHVPTVLDKNSLKRVPSNIQSRKNSHAREIQSTQISQTPKATQDKPLHQPPSISQVNKPEAKQQTNPKVEQGLTEKVNSNTQSQLQLQQTPNLKRAAEQPLTQINATSGQQQPDRQQTLNPATAPIKNIIPDQDFLDRINKVKLPTIILEDTNANGLQPKENQQCADKLISSAQEKIAEAPQQHQQPNQNPLFSHTEQLHSTAHEKIVEEPQQQQQPSQNQFYPQTDQLSSTTQEKVVVEPQQQPEQSQNQLLKVPTESDNSNAKGVIENFQK